MNPANNAYAIYRGESVERLARTIGVNLSSVNLRISLFKGICPDAIAKLQGKQFKPDATRVLYNLIDTRQVEVVELMAASRTITYAQPTTCSKPCRQSSVQPSSASRATDKRRRSSR